MKKTTQCKSIEHNQRQGYVMANSLVKGYTHVIFVHLETIVNVEFEF